MTITRFETASLHALRSILDDFAKVSRLKCNFDKTMVMPVGTAFGQIIDTAGFTVTDSITLLGLHINYLAEEFTTNFNEVYEKVLRISNFWDRFRLSLSGRIAVAKTLMLPQINYLGCFPDPGTKILNNLQSLIDGFILNNLNVSKDRRYLPPDRGGMGILNLDSFLS